MECGWLARRATPPNLVSVARFLLAPVILLVLFAQERGWAVVLYGLSFATDWLDGFLARRLSMESNAGRVLDPLADNVVAGAVAVALAIRGEMPWWVVGILLVRDVGLITGAVAVARHGKEMPAANTLAKITFAAVEVMVLVHLADWRVLEGPALWIGTAAALASIVFYIRTGISYGRKDAS